LKEKRLIENEDKIEKFEDTKGVIYY